MDPRNTTGWQGERPRKVCQIWIENSNAAIRRAVSMPFAETNGARLNYRFDGPADAPVLVLSNSLGTNLSMWDPQIPALAARFRVLRYDTRGHGESAVTAGPY